MMAMRPVRLLKNWRNSFLHIDHMQTKIKQTIGLELESCYPAITRSYRVRCRAEGMAFPGWVRSDQGNPVELSLPGN